MDKRTSLNMSKKNNDKNALYMNDKDANTKKNPNGVHYIAKCACVY